MLTVFVILSCIACATAVVYSWATRRAVDRQFFNWEHARLKEKQADLELAKILPVAPVETTPPVEPATELAPPAVLPEIAIPPEIERLPQVVAGMELVQANIAEGLLSIATDVERLLYLHGLEGEINTCCQEEFGVPYAQLEPQLQSGSIRATAKLKELHQAVQSARARVKRVPASG